MARVRARVARVRFGEMQTQTLAPPAGVPASWGARSAAGGESADLGMLCGVTPGGEEVNLAPQGRG